MIFRKRVTLFKKLYLNMSKTGIGLSYGLVRGLRIGVNKKGIYYSVGLPGSGLYRIKYIKRFRRII